MNEVMNEDNSGLKTEFSKKSPKWTLDPLLLFSEVLFLCFLLKLIFLAITHICTQLLLIYFPWILAFHTCVSSTIFSFQHRILVIKIYLELYTSHILIIFKYAKIKT